MVYMPENFQGGSDDNDVFQKYQVAEA